MQSLGKKTPQYANEAEQKSELGKKNKITLNQPISP